MASYDAYYITGYSPPDHIEVTAQVLDFSFCEAQFGSPIWGETIDAVQVALGALMCLLVAIKFIRQSLQMYKATKRFQPSRYMALFTREGMFYFFAYVHVPSFLACHSAHVETAS